MGLKFEGANGGYLMFYFLINQIYKLCWSN